MKFKSYSFKELLSNIVDNRGKTCPVGDAGLPLIATNCIKEHSLYPVYEKVRYVSDETYTNWFRGHPQPGDMIFVCKGSPGRVNWVPDPVNFCIAQDMVAIRADTTKVYPKYLFALLRSQASQQKILNMHVGSLIPHFKKGDFGNLYFELPEDLEYQKKVGDAYFDFCLKIESNNQLNQTLEQMAQAIFKSWFVDFDPVKAKMNGEQPVGMDADTALLFPEKLVESELGLIPEGWEVGSLSSIVDVIMGQSPKGTTYNDQGEGTPLVNGPVEFGVYHPVAQKWTTAPTKLSKNKDLIVCVRGSTTGRYVVSDGEYCLGRGVCSIRSDDSPAFANYLFKSHLNNLLNLTTGSTFPSWSGPTLKNFKVVVPPQSIIGKFETIVGNLCSMMAQNTGENESLSLLRDTLLPKLLSGEIDLAPQGNQ
ncbi:restriction endonuclease subunit S [Photobacterium damselae]|uniref:Predicted nucleotidyltransferases n=2 Tax=Photobacterium damselae TaxID=38293 RepID=A0A2T3QME4_PHODM|nr:restriction endonuclease subunit S [Photobacterium damselae]EEZ40262.1 putative type I restriction-modification system subunit S [Photobacterium damselae subsp. damselae CIP 102761]PSW86180.1 restriction endonuclease subunit S [Photobacterium damselae]SPY29173.1 Predicted nucleotidyltransferases [Photobacterium damselae]